MSLKISGQRSAVSYQRSAISSQLIRERIQIAMGSASELEYHLLLAKDLGMLSELKYKKVEECAIEVKRMLSSLILKLKADR